MPAEGAGLASKARPTLQPFGTLRLMPCLQAALACLYQRVVKS